jgi:hypothetical protein
MARSLLSEFLMFAGLVTIIAGVWTFSRALGLIACGALLLFLGWLSVDISVRRSSAGG